MLIYKFSHFGNHKKKILYVSIYLISSLTGGPMKRHKTLQMQRLLTWKLFRFLYVLWLLYHPPAIAMLHSPFVLALCLKFIVWHQRVELQIWKSTAEVASSQM